MITNKAVGFTIVELLVVIVVIGILASITIVSFNGVVEKADVASLKSDLVNASKRLKIFQVQNNNYPATNDCGIAESTVNICLKSSGANQLTYNYNSTTNTFGLSAAKGASGTGAYRITSDSTPIPCPLGFVVVPGSATYGTTDFCVMKYEAKNVAGVASSVADGSPWVGVSQSTSATHATNACKGCHLITEAEWLTIAQNILKVPSNWSGGSVGTVCVFNGNLGADTTCGYNGSNPESGSGRNSKASLTLQNGETIWDLSGNVWEWTSGTVTTGRPGGAVAGYQYREWPAVSTPGSMSPNPSPATTGIAGSATWDSATNGIGRLASDISDVFLTGLIRGGDWETLSNGGIMSLNLGNVPTYQDIYVGFRVTR